MNRIPKSEFRQTLFREVKKFSLNRDLDSIASSEHQ